MYGRGESAVKTSAIAPLDDSVAGPRVALLDEGFPGHALRRKTMPLWLRIGSTVAGSSGVRGLRIWPGTGGDAAPECPHDLRTRGEQQHYPLTRMARRYN